MKRFKNFALKRPFMFGFALFIIFFLLNALSYPVQMLLPETGPWSLLASMLAKLVTFGIFLWVLSRFGWLKSAGFKQLGKPQTWLGIFLILIYLIVLEVYAFTGDLTFPIPDPPMAAATLLDHLGTGLVEETMVRGLVLVAMVLAWGETQKGLVKAVLLSSIFFGIIHLANVIVSPVGTVVAQAIVVSLPGILYATLTLAFRSIWPAILIHWLTNAAVNIKLIALPDFEETFSMWLIFAAGLIPVLVYSAYLIRKLPAPFEYVELEPEIE
ncbi:MAG: CPBP family intramembrane glutamic endopeptidase [Anaerolineales bacterium]